MSNEQNVIVAKQKYLQDNPGHCVYTMFVRFSVRIFFFKVLSSLNFYRYGNGNGILNRTDIHMGHNSVITADGSPKNNNGFYEKVRLS